MNTKCLACDGTGQVEVLELVDKSIPEDLYLYSFVGKSIATISERKRITATALAAALSIKLEDLTRIEAGDYKIDTIFAFRIAKVLDCPLSEMLPTGEEYEARNFR